VANYIFSIIPHDVGVESKLSLARDDICWWEPNTAGDMFGEEFIVRQFT
jgi:hypothetical protein